MKYIKRIGLVVSAASLVVASAVMFMPRSATAAPAGTTITGLWNTGVADDGSKLATGQVDPHWRLVAIEEPENGAPHCQTTPLGNAYVTGSNVAVPISNDGGATVEYTTAWPYSPSNANWLGAQTSAQHNNSAACPDPSDALAGTVAPVGFPNNDRSTWVRWTFQMSDFYIPNNVDLSSVNFTINGLVDNAAEVYINGQKIADLQEGSGFSSAQPNSFAVPSSALVHGANSLRVRVASNISVMGFIVSYMSAEAKYLPTLAIEKDAPATGVVGTPFDYVITVTNGSTDSESTNTSGTITVTDTIPDGLEIGTLPAGCSVTGQVVTCDTTQVLTGDGSDAWKITIPVTPRETGEFSSPAETYGGSSINCVVDMPCVASARTVVEAAPVITTPTDPASPDAPGTPDTGVGHILQPFMFVALGVLAVVMASFGVWRLVRART